MLRLLIVDDEMPARNRLRRMLKQHSDCEVVAEAASGQEALELIAVHQPDALFLDISMPGLDGMGLAQLLQKQSPSPAVIFCTAWPDRALEAFNCDAIDYLLKPVRTERLGAALEKARRASPELQEEAGEGPFLYATVGGRTELIDVGEVACLLAEDKYTTVFHDRGKSVINDPLVSLEEQHGERFLRVHRNALVARSRVKGLERAAGTKYCVVLDGCPFRPAVSRRQLPEVRRLIRRWK